MKSRILISLFTLLSAGVFAQNVNYQVQVSYLGWDGRGDQNGGAEYALRVWSNDNINTSDVGNAICFYTNDVGGSAGSITSTIGGTLYGESVALGSQNNTSATTINIHFMGYEKDCSNNCTYQSGCNCVFGLCATEDDDYIDQTNAQTITYQDPAFLCQWKDWGIIQVGSFYFQVRVYWEYVTIPAPVISSAQTLCSGGTAAALTSTGATLAGVTYVWQDAPTPGGPFTSTLGTTPASYSPGTVTADTYYQLVMSNAGCTGTTATASNVIGITLGAAPTNVAVSGVTTRCQGSGTDLFTGTGTNATAFTWAALPTTAGTIDATGTMTWDSTFSGSVTITTTADNNGCGSVTASTNLFVSPAPFVAISALDTAYCSNTSVFNLVGFPTGGSFTVNGTAATSFDPTALGVGLQSVRYDYTYSFTGCSNYVVQSVNINDLPTVSLAGPALDQCLNAMPVTLVGTPSGGTFNGPGVIGTSYNPSVGGVGTQTITYTYQDSNGCEGTSSSDINVIDIASSVNLGSDTVICNGLAVTLDATGNFSSYLWNDVAATTTPQLTVTQPGIYEVAATDTNGCINTDQIAVTAGDLLQPTITGNGTGNIFCEGDTLILDAGVYSSYVWNTTETTQTITVTSGGDYSVFATDAAGCSGYSSVVSVYVFTAPNPVVTSSGPTSFCPGGQVQLCGPTGFVQYQWTDGSTTPCVSYNNAGQTELTVVDANGCSATSPTIPYDVYALSTPVITVSGPTEFCLGGSVILDVGSGWASILWSSGNTTPSVTVTQTGSYSVIVMDQNGCIDSSLIASPIAVTVTTAHPSVTITGTTIAVTTPYVSYQWHEWLYDTQDSILAGATSQSYTAKGNGCFFVEVVDAGGCPGVSDTFCIRNVGFEEAAFAENVRIFPNPVSDFVDVSFNNLSASPVSVYITDLSGRLVRNLANDEKGKEVKLHLSIDNISGGTYLLWIESGKQRIAEKIIKR